MGNEYHNLAAEYYDPIAHPTCANFRELSIKFFQRHLTATLEKSRVLEVGAGNSAAAEILAGRLDSLEDLTITDESELMLNYSRHWVSKRATLKIASATSLPFSSRSFDIIISSLGDPYNCDAFWHQCSRVLKESGCVLFSTPSFDWARDFRSCENRNLAEFEIGSGGTVEVNSFVYPLSDQLNMIRKASLLVDVVDFYYAEDVRSTLSTKLIPEKSELPTPVLWGIVATKPSIKR